MRLLQHIQSVVAAMFGVQSHKRYQHDFQTLPVGKLIVIAILFVVLLILALMLIIELILN